MLTWYCPPEWLEARVCPRTGVLTAVSVSLRLAEESEEPAELFFASLSVMLTGLGASAALADLKCTLRDMGSVCCCAIINIQLSVSNSSRATYLASRHGWYWLF